MPNRIKENGTFASSHQTQFNGDSPLKQKRTMSEVVTEDLPFMRRCSPRKHVNGNLAAQFKSPKSPISLSGHSLKKCDDVVKLKDIQLKSDFILQQVNGDLSESKRRKAPSDCSLQASSPGKRKSTRRCTSGGQNGDLNMNSGNGPAQLPKSPRKRLSDQFSQKSKWNPKDSAQMHALKEALHVSIAPSSILCREEEQKRVFEFCQHRIQKENGGSLYVCGCPGTGKTLSVEKVKEKLVTWAKDGGFMVPDIMSINCTSLVSSSEIFDKIVESYHPRKKLRRACAPLKYLQDLFSQKELPSVGKMMLIIVDEMDYLITKDRAVLHDLFMLTTLPFSKFILLGISNAIDLADRFLPKLQSLNCKPMLITFRAYSKEQILKILQQRLMAVSTDAFQPQALELCARRVAAASGDMRKALSVCRTAVELLEAELRSPASFDLSSDSSSMVQLGPDDEKILQPDMNIVGKGRTYGSSFIKDI
ncbi:cell division control protein 6 homolog B-like isoform X2 [Aristolochia californica]|uniref:cell division control protein 6 homolog B-like isoform X2 n=1 Tax=Aristolochia californica TaxID=171875 RepID=UPI0035DC92D2